MGDRAAARYGPLGGKPGGSADCLECRRVARAVVEPDIE